MRLRSQIAAVIAICALGLPQTASAQIHLPVSVPGVDSSDLAAKAAARQLQPYFDAHQPVIRDWSYLYPTVSALPGMPFHPTNVQARQLTIERNVIAQLRAPYMSGIVTLARGDYAVPVRLFCTNLHGHANAPYIYLLGPLRGSRAAVLSEMYAHSAAANPHFGDLQSLSWSLQDGLSYSQLGERSQRLFDELVPGKRAVIGDNFVDDLQQHWDGISGSIPGTPSFADSLGKIGPLGQNIEQMREAQDQLIDQSIRFNVLSASMVLGPMGKPDSNVLATPWSVPWAGTYLRLLTQGAFGSLGLLEIRVVLPHGRVPITDNIGYPPKCMQCQPLTMRPKYNAQPSPPLPVTIGVFAV